MRNKENIGHTMRGKQVITSALLTSKKYLPFVNSLFSKETTTNFYFYLTTNSKLVAN